MVRRLVKARSLIDRAYDEPLTLSDLAAEACMSDAHFVRQFRAEFGITPYRCLTERRLQAARELLAETDMPVADIVAETGFGNRSAFSRLFKSRCGISPQAYRLRRRRQRKAPEDQRIQETPRHGGWFAAAASN
ncbi:MAG: AraC family transcriptional regulator [Xanthomonadales bacterium]|nr:AraC family transcriptional regulator [Xanthomonadales bacterium]